MFNLLLHTPRRASGGSSTRVRKPADSINQFLGQADVKDGVCSRNHTIIVGVCNHTIIVGNGFLEETHRYPSKWIVFKICTFTHVELIVRVIGGYPDIPCVGEPSEVLFLRVLRVVGHDHHVSVGVRHHKPLTIDRVVVIGLHRPVMHGGCQQVTNTHAVFTFVVCEVVFTFEVGVGGVVGIIGIGVETGEDDFDEVFFRVPDCRTW